MKATVINLDALRGIGRQLREIADLDNEDAVRPLLEKWGRVIIEDNRRGVLNGQDRHGNPVPPVTYRKGNVIPTRGRRRGSDRWGRAMGTYKPGVGANLTTAEYRRLTGPPLAPRRGNSRIIQNLGVEYGRTSTGWETVGAWKDVVRPDGLPLLPPHFAGAKLRKGRLPKRDMAGLRPQGRREARRVARQWAVAYLRVLTGR